MFHTLMEDFLIHCLFLAMAFPVILTVKKVLKRCLTVQSQHTIWYLYCFAALYFFLPIRLPDFADPASFFHSLIKYTGQSAASLSSSAAALDTSGWMNDYAVSVRSSVPELFFPSLFWVWAAGASAVAVIMLCSRIRLNRLGRSMAFVKNQETEQLFTACKKELGIRRRIRFVLSESEGSPMAFGIFFPVIVFPKRYLSAFSSRELCYIFYHELNHYKRGDLVCNFICCIIRSLYWFHPAVLLSLRKMRTDREIACDAAVLDHIRSFEWNAYGHTILNFAGYVSSAEGCFVSSGIGGTSTQLKHRIKSIASYCRASKKKRFASITLLLVFGILFSSFFLENNILAGSVSKNPDRPVTYTDLSSHFSEKKGCFVLYDQKKSSYSIYNHKMSRQRVSPDSTYKIYSALAAMDAGMISPEKTDLPWDKKQYPFSSWNRDQSLNSAMKSSVNWYFQRLDTSLGKTALKKHIRRIGYGNENISAGISSFWMESSLKISPLEQVMLLRDFDQNRFGYSKETVDAVRDSIRLSEDSGRTLYGKTGTGNVDGHDINGWFIGFLKTKNNTFYFALRIQGDDNASGKEAAKAALSIIDSLSL